jgi:hypothetical protein
MGLKSEKFSLMWEAVTVVCEMKVVEQSVRINTLLK